MNSSPTSLFDSYEQDFTQIIDAIREKLDGENNDGDLDQRKAVLRRVEMELDEADEMVSQMEIEIQGIPQPIRPQYQDRLRAANEDLTRYKKQCHERRNQHSRFDLLGSTGQAGLSSFSDDPYTASSDRTRLLAGTQLLEDGTKRLQDSQRIALETEDQGAEILMNLRTQREHIQHSRDTLRMADTSIDRASKTLKRMITRMYQQRFVTGTIILVLVLLIGVILWEKVG